MIKVELPRIAVSNAMRHLVGYRNANSTVSCSVSTTSM